MYLFPMNKIGRHFDFVRYMAFQDALKL